MLQRIVLQQTVMTPIVKGLDPVMKATKLCPSLVTMWLIAGVCFFLSSATRAVADAAIPEGMKVVGVSVWPTELKLSGPLTYRQILVTGKTAAGQSLDLTRAVKLAQAAKIVTLSPTGMVRPKVDGSEQLVLQVAGHSVPLGVTVENITQSLPTSFVQDVQPVLSKMGCTQGTCHGARKGKGGFKLSLRGYDALYDHRAFTDDIGARRINRASPDQSLMLLKLSGSIPHVGGVLATPDDDYYKIVRDWIAEGVKLDLDADRVTGIEIFPKKPVIPLADMSQQMVVYATFSDGTVRDVTTEAFIESGDTEIIETDRSGLATTIRRGEAPVLARYQGAYTATTVTVMGDRSGFQWKLRPANNFIDTLAYEKLKRVKVLPSELCTDAEFIRRASIDLTGLPPSSTDVREFLADTRQTQTKRDALVDRLVGSGPYVEFWTNKWADMLLVNRKFLGEEGAAVYRNWIKQSVSANKPYNQFAYEVLTASGSNRENPAASYFKVLREPEDTMENTTQAFLGVRFSCNKCHDHPFERWTQSQYYHLSAFFAQVGLKEDQAFAGKRIGGTAVEGAKPLVEVIYDKGSGEVKHLQTGLIAQPEFPYQADLKIDGDTRRERLASWVTSAENQYFARSYVNRVWAYLLGMGLIEPIDDIRAGNPPSNPELLAALEKEFIESKFDIQHMMSMICKSRTYQRSIATNRWNEDDQINFSHAIPKRLPAEVLYDSIHYATGSTMKLPGMPAGFRAAELTDAGIAVTFLDDFGRPAREASCECERSGGMVLGPVMKLVNGPTLANAIADSGNALATLVASEADNTKVVEELFLRLMARYPTEAETKLSVETILATEADEGEDSRLLGVQDLAWALINNSAFLFNH